MWRKKGLKSATTWVPMRRLWIKYCLYHLSTCKNDPILSAFQVLDVIAPPYTSDFVQLFLPILENESIAGTIKTEGEHDPVTEFIGKSCFFVYLLQFVNES